ncbi:MAG TPA: HD domain-containing phosphohydrolase [Candidatus Limnocylindria bacterium]
MAALMRLADLLASVSLLSDLGFALPAEESMRTTIIGTALARRLHLAEDVVSDVFYTCLLQHVGCTGFAHETAGKFGDEMVINAAAARTDSNDLGDLVDTYLRAATKGRGPFDFARVALYTFIRGDSFGRQFAAARCEVGRATARRLGLSSGVQRGLHEVAESWNGGSGALGLRGDDISIVARIATAAATASRFVSIGGASVAVAAVGRRAGGELDPTIVATVVEHGSEILAESHDGDPRDILLAVEPTPVRSVAGRQLAGVAAAIGDVADLKSVFTVGHSSGVAGLAADAAAGMNLDQPARARLQVAALLHDLGRVGTSASIWERPGPLSVAEWEQVRLHPYHSERILARSEALQPMAAIAGMHHERLDGSGYHRGSRGREISLEARILAAADAFQAMTEPRPHRPALDPEAAAGKLLQEGRGGRLDASAVGSVLDAAGVAAKRPGRSFVPGGLSDREVEVLRLVARGLTNRQIAHELTLSPRTAEHHVQHIYTKLGVSSRAAAALFAMEHDLL